MSDALAVVPQSIEASERLSVTLAKSQLLPSALLGKPSDVLVILLTGAELGFGPMQSIRAIDIIKGKPCLKAEAMAALVKRRRDVCEFLTIKESTDKRAVYETKRVGDLVPTTITFTIEDATRAGLMSNDNWKKFPAAMLRARCVSALCKSVYPDLCLGLYESDSEEIPRPPATVSPIRPEPVDAEWTTEPDAVAAATVAPDPTEALAWIAEAATLAELGALTPRIQKAGCGKDPAFRAAYSARLAALKGGA